MQDLSDCVHERSKCDYAPRYFSRNRMWLLIGEGDIGTFPFRCVKDKVLRTMQSKAYLN